MKRVGAFGVFAVLVGVASGCGGASKYAEPPASPASAPQQQPAYPQSQGYPQAEKSAAPPAGAAPEESRSAPAATSPPPPPAPAPVAPPAPSRDESASSTRRDDGLRELEIAERGIASSDCGTACRALGSMERAVVFICVSSQGGDDANRCDDAKDRLLGARRKVRASCGSCPNGASVDPGAPIPSRK